MNKTKKVLFSMLVMSLLIIMIAEPAFADDIYDRQISISYYSIPWGNGVDDDGDGVIDNFEELDVQYGNQTYNLTDCVIDGWYTEWKYYNYGTFDYVTDDNHVRNGVKIGAHYEELWQIDSSANASVSPTQTCYYAEDDVYLNYDQYHEVTDVLNVCTHYVELSPSDIMTGCQEFWYRSPICWDNSTLEEVISDSGVFVPEHYLNIYDESGSLVWASGEVSGDYSVLGYTYNLANPFPRNVADNSTTGTDYTRLYYKITMPFDTEEKYKFEEYVKIIDDNPINNIKLYMAPNQDIADDGLLETLIFKGTSNARMVPAECSWGMLATIGKGLAGTENIIFSGYNDTFVDIALDGPEIRTQWIYGDDSVDDVDAITLVFPLRTTKPLDIGIYVVVDSAGNTWSDVFHFSDITGTAILTFNITDPDAGAPNLYFFNINIENFDEGPGDAMTYTMFPANGTFHRLYYNGMVPTSYERIHYACLAEVREYETVKVEESSGPDALEFLIGLDFLMAGFIILSFVSMIIAPVSIPLLAGGVIFAGVNMVLGGALMIHSFSGEGIYNFPQWFADQLPRAALQIWEGIVNLAKGLYHVIVKVVETILDLGNALFYYGGIVLEAIVDIIYFITAVFVWWLMAKFLQIMGSIRDGDVEKAAKQIVQVENAAFKGTVGRYRRYGKPIVRRGGKRDRERAESRREEEHRLYERFMGRA